MVEHDLDADADEDDAAGDRRGFFPTVAELMADCHAAKRDDERRDADQSNRRLFPVEKAPFYAAKFQPAMMLVCCGGLESDEDCHTFTNDGEAEVPEGWISYEDQKKLDYLYADLD